MSKGFQRVFPYSHPLQIKTECTLSAAWNPNNPQESVPPHVNVYGLWDTGATHSAVSKRIANILKLQVEGYIPMAHAMGQAERVPIHHVNFTLPGPALMPGIQVSQCDLIGIDVLIGMDIIAIGKFCLTNKHNGTIEFAFDYPF